MRIYLVQHGKSFSKEVDPERRLTEEGIIETELIAKHLARTNIKLGKIYHSVKTRARMTAEIFSKYLGTDIEEAEGLSPLDDPRLWLGRIKSLKEDIMIVGHLPHLSKLTTLLLNIDREVVKITNSSVLCLEEEAGRWIIKWYMTPDVIIR